MSNSALNTIKGVLSHDFTIMAYDCLANKNTAALYQLGLDDGAIECLAKMKIKDIKLTTIAFEKALSIQTYVDPVIVKSVLINFQKQQKQEILINGLVASGAGFEMIRHFVKNYTNRQHTQLRQDLKVNNSDIAKKTKTLGATKADEYFGSFITNNKTINIEDILNFSQEENYSLSSIWKELKEFINNSA